MAWEGFIEKKTFGQRSLGHEVVHGEIPSCEKSAQVFEEPHVAVACEWRVAGNGICKVTRCQAEHHCVESDFYLPLGSVGQRMPCLRC